MRLIENVKGIKKLEIEEGIFKKLKDKKVVGIYGPNGSGKSSFKLGITWKGKIPIKWRHFDSKNLSSFVEKEIKVSKKIAIFDENLVNLIRNNKEEHEKGIWFLDEEIKSLYQLLVNKDKILKDNPAIEEIWEAISAINTIDISKILKEINNLEYIIKEIKTGKMSINKNKFNKEISFYFERTFNKIFENLTPRNLQFNNSENTMENRSFNTNDLNMILSKGINGKKVNKNEIKKSIKELNIIKEFLLDILYIVNNFGYVEYKNRFENIIENRKFINKIDYDVNFLGFQINNFVKLLNDESIITIKDVWDEIKKKVSKVLKISDNLLQTYGLKYRVNIEPTTIENKSNFGLKYISPNSENSIKLQREDLDTFLSYGELNIISLSLFLSAALLRGNLIGSVFIFDDPISSYDLNKVQTTITIIRKFIFDRNEIKKIYFLSHEKHFIKKLKFPFKDNIALFKLSSGITSILEYKEKIETDFDFYNSLLNSEDKIVQAIAKRYFATLYDEVEKPYEKKSFYSRVIHYALEEKINKINFNDYENIKKNELISFRNKISIMFSGSFWTWLNEKASQILSRIINNDDVSEEEHLILQCNTYQDTLNSIAHEEQNGANLDISRVDEIIDILYESRKNLLKCFEKATTSYENSISFNEDKESQIKENKKYEKEISAFFENDK